MRVLSRNNFWLLLFTFNSVYHKLYTLDFMILNYLSGDISCVD